MVYICGPFTNKWAILTTYYLLRLPPLLAFPPHPSLLHSVCIKHYSYTLSCLLTHLVTFVNFATLLLPLFTFVPHILTAFAVAAEENEEEEEGVHVSSDVPLLHTHCLLFLRPPLPHHIIITLGLTSFLVILSVCLARAPAHYFWYSLPK